MYEFVQEFPKISWISTKLSFEYPYFHIISMHENAAHMMYNKALNEIKLFFHPQYEYLQFFQQEEDHLEHHK